MKERKAAPVSNRRVFYFSAFLPLRQREGNGGELTINGRSTSIRPWRSQNSREQESSQLRNGVETHEDRDDVIVGRFSRPEADRTV